MKLSDILLSEKTVSFPYPGCDKLYFDLTYLSTAELKSINNKCKTNRINKKTRQVEQILDDDLFLELYIGKAISGWKGFKLKYLKEFALAEVPKGDEEIELNYSEDNALELIQNSQIFDNWVSDTISDLGNFEQMPSTGSASISKVTPKKVPQA